MKKLTEDQWYQLSAQLEKTPTMNDDVVSMGTGEHYQVMHLLGTFGHCVRGKQEAMKLAMQLLDMGYERADNDEDWRYG